ncbi:MAG: RNA polymerase sigma factor, partial [Planctomycetota bacterium]
MSVQPTESAALRPALAAAASNTRAALLDSSSTAFAHDPRLARLLSFYASAYQLAARTLGTTRDAEDIVQQAYIKALTHLPAAMPDAEIQPWFFRVVVNAAHDQRRSELRRRAREAAGSAAAGSATATDSLEPGLPDGVTREMLADLHACLNGLEERLRLPLVLCYEQGLSQNAAAQVLDMPPRTLSKYLEDGLERLRQKMAERGHTAAPALLIAALPHGAPAVPIGLDAMAREILRDAPHAAPTPGPVPAPAAPAPAAPSVSALPAKAGMHIGWKILIGVLIGGVACVALLIALFFIFLFLPSVTTSSSSARQDSIDVAPDGVSVHAGRQSQRGYTSSVGGDTAPPPLPAVPAPPATPATPAVPAVPVPPAAAGPA